MISKVLIRMISGNEYEVNQDLRDPNDLQEVLDDIMEEEFFILEKSNGKRPKLLKTANIESIDLL